MKKIISLILSILMIFSCASVAIASEDYNHLPQIYVEGLDSNRIYYKEDVNKENPLFFPIDFNEMLAKLMKYEEHLKNAVYENNPNILSSYLYFWFYDCFGDIALGTDGYTSSEKVWVPGTELNYNGDGKYIFKYDSRLGPSDIAKELYEVYIPMVQKETGSAKFELVASSYGTSVALALLNDYPQVKENIDSLVLCVPSVNDVNFAGEVFSGSFDVKPEAFKAFLDTNIGDDSISMLLSALIKTGSLDFLLDALVEPALKFAILDALKRVIHDIFGTMPCYWSFVDDRYLHDALEYTYGADYKDPDHEYAGLIKRITDYHENVKMRSSEIVKEVQESGIHTSIICKYGAPSIPLSKEGNVLGDGLVTVEMASFGAVCAMNQEKLPADYQQAKFAGEKNYMSPDWCIDASTCLLPDNTWFIKNLNHGTKPEGYYEMVNSIAYGNLDVSSDERYPQFMTVPENNSEIVVPLVIETTELEEKETTWWQDFIAFIKGIFPRLIEMIKGLFAK